MKKDTWDTLCQCTQKDQKTLTQKALKLCEEVGELAQVVLPFEGAHGPTHKPTSKELILEESTDVVLVALSIALTAGFSRDQIEEMMTTKLKKWASIIKE